MAVIKHSALGGFSTLLNQLSRIQGAQGLSQRGYAGILADTGARLYKDCVNILDSSLYFFKSLIIIHSSNKSTILDDCSRLLAGYLCQIPLLPLSSFRLLHGSRTNNGFVCPGIKDLNLCHFPLKHLNAWTSLAQLISSASIPSDEPFFLGMQYSLSHHKSFSPRPLIVLISFVKMVYSPISKSQSSITT